MIISNGIGISICSTGSDYGDSNQGVSVMLNHIQIRHFPRL